MSRNLTCKCGASLLKGSLNEISGFCDRCEADSKAKYSIITGIQNKKPPSAMDRQEGGKHYKSMAIQPVEYIFKNDIGFIEGSVIKYVTRWKSKGGVEDLKKARHFLDMLIEMSDVADKLQS